MHGLPSKPVFDDEVTRRKVNNNCVYLVQHCLVHLGDLARYKRDWDLAEKFYRMATQVAPRSGQAYNQLAVLEANFGRNLGAIFYHVRALTVKYPFPSAAANLSKLFGRVEGVSRKECPISGVKTVSSEKFFIYGLTFQSFAHSASRLRSAAKINLILNSSLTDIIAKSDLDPLSLLQYVTVTLFLLDRQGSDDLEELSEDEVKVKGLLLDSLARMLNAFVLPVYTIKQGEALLQYFALPTVKIIFDWISLNPQVLEDKAFLKRIQIWPSFCRMLKELSDVLKSSDKLKELCDLSDQPLPEETDLEAFLPLCPKEKVKKKTVKAMKVKDDLVPYLRAQKLIEIGKYLASDQFKGKESGQSRGWRGRPR